MRSWVKALLISAMTFVLVIIFLPSLAKPGVNSLLPWILQQANLDNVDVEISNVSWYQFTLDKLSFSTPSENTDSPLDTFSLQQLTISYSPFKLLSGQVNEVEINQLGIILKSPEVVNTSAPKNSTISPSQDKIPSPQIILPTAEEIFAQLPMEKLSINQLSITHPQIKIEGELQVTTEEISLNSTLHISALNQPLKQHFRFNHQGKLTAQITPKNSGKSSKAPIFILQGEWLDKTVIGQEGIEQEKVMSLSLQQSADIESWLDLINNDQRSSQLLAKTAIQAWSVELSVPKLITDPNKILQEIVSEGLLQIQINDFSILPADNSSAALLSHADLSFNAKTYVNHIKGNHIKGNDVNNNKQERFWQLIIEDFDVKGTTQVDNDLALNIQQQLTQPLNIDCSLSQDININCQWQGKIKQSLNTKDLNSNVEIDISGSFTDNPTSGSDFILRKSLEINIQQNNQRWPRLDNTTSGEIILSAHNNTALTGDNFWHWQLNLPFGLTGKTTYHEQLPDALAKGELSSINWQLLPDWQLEGIDAELTDAKALSFIINDLSWIEKRNRKNNSDNKSFLLEQAKLSCTFDWLKLQYSPQLRSSNSVESLPLSCNWQANNKASHWQQWPLPALAINGDVQLSSLNFSQAKLRSEIKVSGLNETLDISLHTQHDFAGMQKGAAQIYINNLKLEWSELGLSEMQNLTQAQLLDGTLSAQGWVQWQQYQEDIFDDGSIAWRWQPDIMLRVDDLAGIYNNTTAWDDVDFQMAIRRPFYQSFKLASQISANSINPGIKVSNILARSTTTIEADFSKALIVIEEIHSDVLGGRIEVPLIRFDTSQEVNAFGIKVEGLQVSQLAALEADSGITATGTLDGVLPIILLPEGPQVPAGTLYARSPGGLINYQNDVAAALKDSDPTVGLAMQVLEDFHYDKLQTDITYQPTGELKLGLQFQGKNPTFFDGQATHLNLNLDYNLLDLLESLRISNDIVQKLENKYQ
jgi:hypothetical protein